MTAQTETASDAAERSEDNARRVLQRVIFPEDRDLDVLPLYVDYGASIGVPREEEGAAPIAEVNVVDALASARHPENILDRHRLRVVADQRVSFATYFNGFAASYWRMWSVIEEVVLRVRVSGEATIIVYRSTADGRSQRVDSASSASEVGGDFEFVLPLKPFGDGGWYWFDVWAGEDDAVLEEAAWCADVPADRAEMGTATVGITVIRPDSAVPLLGQLAADKEVMSVLDEVIVVDQGTERVRDEPDCARIDAAMGGKLRIIEQGNIGGSGGFARSQYETVKAGTSTYVLLLDDDIVAEPESILRAITFADLARRPTLVGGHMFSLYARSQLHSFGEQVARWRFWWGPASRVIPEYDLANRNLRATRWLHHRVDVDYNGWWMCLIPRVVMEEIGLGLPLFIKWDDAEYGLRAQAAGYPTVSMPGVAVWHVPWTDKNDALDWQAYYHQRNRTVAALLHSPYDYGGRIVRESFIHQVKHLLAMQYSTAELRLQALEDILSGPGHLHAQIVTKLPQVREMRTEHSDAQTKPHADAFPRPRLLKPPKRGHDPADPQGKLAQLKTATLGSIRQLLPVRDLAKRHPEARIAARDARWWRLVGLDSAIVSTTDGTAASWYRREPKEFQRLLRRTIRIHEQFALEWPRLSKEYRGSLPELTSMHMWESTFDAARKADDQTAGEVAAEAEPSKPESVTKTPPPYPSEPASGLTTAPRVAAEPPAGSSKPARAEAPPRASEEPQ
jgi:galactofuranosylgalactofuranosylrhamnosyl-N-acetylglucosaminyl-diphospho-decaprenol beta-1,5/1,6-galactofuranosyltransferase